MKTIGPTFEAELRIAGVYGQQFSWQANGVINYGDTIAHAQMAAVDAVYAAHDPDAVITPTPLQQIRALEFKHDDDQRKLNRQAAIDTALTIVCRSPAAAGKTRAEVHDLWYAANRGYRAMVDLEAHIVELRKQIV